MLQWILQPVIIMVKLPSPVRPVLPVAVGKRRCPFFSSMME